MLKWNFYYSYLCTAGWTIAIFFWLVQLTFTLNVSSQSSMPPLDWSQRHVVMCDHAHRSPGCVHPGSLTSYKTPLASSAQELCSTLVLVWKCLNGIAGYLSELCVPVARPSASQVSLDGPTTSAQGPNHDRLAELRCPGTISVDQSLYDLMCCWRTEGTFTTIRRCCGVFVIMALDIKLQT